MECRILYCKPCGYRARAESLADELRTRFGAKVEVEHGGFGQFDVFVDGELAASKGKLLARMLKHAPPDEPELLASIERHLALREGDACEIPGTPTR